jgi:hypothetical protein
MPTRKIARPRPMRVIPISKIKNQRFTPKPGTNQRNSDLILRRTDKNQTSRRLDITRMIAVFKGIVNHAPSKLDIRSSASSNIKKRNIIKTVFYYQNAIILLDLIPHDMRSTCCIYSIWSNLFILLPSTPVSDQLLSQIGCSM